MKNLSKVLKLNNYRKFKIKETDQIEIVSGARLKSAQEGYRFNPIKNEEIETWKQDIGESFYVIGFDNVLGDAILVDTASDNLPVFVLNQESFVVTPVANSFEEFIKNLKELDIMINTQNQDRATIRKHATALDKKFQTQGFYKGICFDVLDRSGLYYNEFRANNRDLVMNSK